MLFGMVLPKVQIYSVCFRNWNALNTGNFCRGTTQNRDKLFLSKTFQLCHICSTNWGDYRQWKIKISMCAMTSSFTNINLIKILAELDELDHKKLKIKITQKSLLLHQCTDRVDHYNHQNTDTILYITQNTDMLIRTCTGYNNHQIQL